MKVVATTLHIETSLKKAAEHRALQEGITFEVLSNQALRTYLNEGAEEQTREIVFLTKDLGVPLDNLTRADFYDE